MHLNRSHRTSISRNRSTLCAAQQVIPGGVNSPVRAFRSVGGHAALHRARRRAPIVLGCRWQPLHRLRPVVGAADAGPRASGRRRCAARGRRPRHQLRRADRAGDRTGAAGHRPGAVGRDGPLCQQRHRGHHERAAAGARLHRARPRSSSSAAATTGTPTCCWCRRAAASPRWACPIRRACPRPRRPTR